MWDRRSSLSTLLRGEGRWETAPRQMLAPETKTPTRTQKRLKCDSTNTLRAFGQWRVAARRATITTCGRPRDTPMRLRRCHPGSQTIAQLNPRGEKACRQRRGETRCQSLIIWRGGWPSLRICCPPSRRPWGLSLSRTGFDIDGRNIATRLTSKSEDLKLQRTHSTRQFQHLASEPPTPT